MTKTPWKLPPNIRIVPTETSYIGPLRVEIDKVLDAIGHPEAFVTDESLVIDFLPVAHHPRKLELNRISAALGVPVDAKDYVWEVAARLRPRG